MTHVLHFNYEFYNYNYMAIRLVTCASSGMPNEWAYCAAILSFLSSFVSREYALALSAVKNLWFAQFNVMFGIIDLVQNTIEGSNKYKCELIRELLNSYGNDK